MQTKYESTFLAGAAAVTAAAALMILADQGLAPLVRAQVPPGQDTRNRASVSDQVVQDAVRTIEEDDRKAMLGSDTEALERYWSADLIVNAPSNEIKSRPEVLDLVKSGQLKYSSFERQIERIVAEGDIAVAMGAETVVPVGGLNAGKTVHRRYTDVYTRRSGQWQLIARQATIVR
jgi:ketosteroid isomerase-like protein